MHKIFFLLMIIAMTFNVTTRLEISGDTLILSWSDSRDAVIFRRDSDSGYNVPPMKIDIPGKWTLDRKPAKQSSSGKTLTPAVVGESYSYTFKASRKGARFSAKGLPEGLRISSSGKITGTPKKAGHFTVDITEQIRSRREKNTFELLVSEKKVPSADVVPQKPESRDIPETKREPPQILSSSIKQAFIDESYTFTLRASEAVTWSCDFLPEGLSLDSSTGIISGLPVSEYRGKVNVTAMSENGTTERPLHFAVKARRPRITTASLPDGFVSEDYTALLRAEGGKGITWSFRGEIPDGLSVSESGVIRGVPERAGRFTLNVYAENSGGRTSRSFALNVSESSPHEYVTAAIIPAFAASDDGYYDFHVSIDAGVPEGCPIEWHSFPYGVEADGEVYVFRDSRGREVHTVPANHNVTVSVWLEGGVVYEPVITARVEVKEETNDEPQQTETYSGCNISCISCMILIHIIMKRDKKAKNYERRI